VNFESEAGETVGPIGQQAAINADAVVLIQREGDFYQRGV
jgi:hypothetical protein